MHASSPIVINAAEHFDGERLITEPRRILICEGQIVTVLGTGSQLPERWRQPGVRHVHSAFCMPGLCDAHVHLFLDGDELDQDVRKRHLRSERGDMLAMGRLNLERTLCAGVTLLRDAGDPHGINHELRAESRASGRLPRIRSAGFAIRNKGRYGSFLGFPVEAEADLEGLVERSARDSDEIKILLTGIIDFAGAKVKGDPQFDAAACERLVAAAGGHGLRTLAHCSGSVGLRLAVECGIDSIEHGFFMDEDLLSVMAARAITWVPTWTPVDFQRCHPEHLALDQAAVDGLHRILDNHLRMIGRAHELGVPLLSGSDAGSFGVPHGRAVLSELLCFEEAGLPLEALLATTTRTPRSLWGLPGGRIVPGEPADCSCFSRSPRQGLDTLERCEMLILGDEIIEPATSGCLAGGQH